jgi:hypothetical protein
MLQLRWCIPNPFTHGQINNTGEWSLPAHQADPCLILIRREILPCTITFRNSMHSMWMQPKMQQVQTYSNEICHDISGRAAKGLVRSVYVSFNIHCICTIPWSHLLYLCFCNPTSQLSAQQCLSIGSVQVSLDIMFICSSRFLTHSWTDWPSGWTSDIFVASGLRTCIKMMFSNSSGFMLTAFSVSQPDCPIVLQNSSEPLMEESDSQKHRELGVVANRHHHPTVCHLTLV